MSQWAAVIGTLGGALIGGLLAFFASERNATHRRLLEDRSRRLGNLEALHECLSAISKQAGVTSALIVLHLSHGLAINKELMGNAEVPLDRARMLADFYVPAINQSISDISNEWETLGQILAECILKKPTTDDEKTALIRKAAGLQRAIIEQTAKAKLKLKEAAQTHFPPAHDVDE